MRDATDRCATAGSDKRTVGYSLLQRDYSVLADDALAGLRLLRGRPDVDPARVGLWAHRDRRAG